jgi:hypothetical protein
VSSYRTSAERKLAAAVLQEWLQLAWELPREQRAAAFAAHWLQKQGMWGWREWLTQRRTWKQLGDSLKARWTNLHLTAAWQAWRAWVQGRQEKARMAETVAKRWNNLHLAAAFQAWVELVKVCRLARVQLLRQECSGTLPEYSAAVLIVMCVHVAHAVKLWYPGILSCRASAWMPWIRAILMLLLPPHVPAKLTCRWQDIIRLQFRP